jgi:hypothetical protein
MTVARENGREIENRHTFEVLASNNLILDVFPSVVEMNGSRKKDRCETHQQTCSELWGIATNP